MTEVEDLRIFTHLYYPKIACSSLTHIVNYRSLHITSFYDRSCS